MAISVLIEKVWPELASEAPGQLGPRMNQNGALFQRQRARLCLLNLLPTYIIFHRLFYHYKSLPLQDYRVSAISF